MLTNNFKRTITDDLSSAKTSQQRQLPSDDTWWRRLSFPTTIKTTGNITSLRFSSEKNPVLGVTCGTRVQFYNVTTSSPELAITRFRTPAHGLSIRKDGQLFCAGGDEALVKLFSYKHKSQLRQFHGHQRSVRHTEFMPDNFRIASFSDDRTVRVWDIASEKEVGQLTGHGDFVRCGGVGNRAAELVCSGSYDGDARIWDVRTGLCTATMTHGQPVEAVVLFPSDAILLTAGGSSIKVWDLVAGGRLLHATSHHHKTITSLSLVADQGLLMSAGLDRHMKLYDSGSYELIHSLNFPAPILNFAYSPGHQVLATVLTEGLLSLQRVQKARQPDEPNYARRQEVSYRYRINKGAYATDDFVVTQARNKTLPQYDQHLRHFKYSKALDTVLKPHFLFERHEVVVALLRELIRIGGLKKALLGRHADSLKPLVLFLGRNLSKQRYTRIIVHVIAVLVDLYGPDLGTEDDNLVTLFQGLREKVDENVEQMCAMSKCIGIMDIILTISAVEAKKQEQQPSAKLPRVLIGEPIIEPISAS